MVWLYGLFNIEQIISYIYFILLFLNIVIGISDIIFNVYYKNLNTMQKYVVSDKIIFRAIKIHFVISILLGICVYVLG